jgi:hypothetical protein
VSGCVTGPQAHTPSAAVLFVRERKAKPKGKPFAVSLAHRSSMLGAAWGASVVWWLLGGLPRFVDLHLCISASNRSSFVSMEGCVVAERASQAADAWLGLQDAHRSSRKADNRAATFSVLRKTIAHMLLKKHDGPPGSQARRKTIQPRQLLRGGLGSLGGGVRSPGREGEVDGHLQGSK